MRSTEASGKSASFWRLSPQKMTRVSRRGEREGRLRPAFAEVTAGKIADCGPAVAPASPRLRRAMAGRLRNEPVFVLRTSGFVCDYAGTSRRGRRRTAGVDEAGLEGRFFGMGIF